jgi:hypothetical protein
MVLFWINLIFSTILFLVTVTFRNRIVYSLVDDLVIAHKVLLIYNVIMILLLALSSAFGIYFGIRHRRFIYWMIATLSALILLISLIGVFLFPRGGVLG